jgi:glutamine amidotransferase PdxT
MHKMTDIRDVLLDELRRDGVKVLHDMQARTMSWEQNAIPGKVFHPYLSTTVLQALLQRGFRFLALRTTPR